MLCYVTLEWMYYNNNMAKHICVNMCIDHLNCWTILPLSTMTRESCFSTSALTEGCLICALHPNVSAQRNLFIKLSLMGCTEGRPKSNMDTLVSNTVSPEKRNLQSQRVTRSNESCERSYQVCG